MNTRILKIISCLFILSVPAIIFSQDNTNTQSDWADITFRYSAKLEEIERKESETASRLQEHMSQDEENLKAHAEILEKIVNKLVELQSENDELRNRIETMERNYSIPSY